MEEGKGWVRGFLTYASYRLIGALAGHLPPRVGYGIARPAALLLYLLSPRLRRILASNFGHVLGPEADEAQVRALVRQACVNILKGHYDLFRLSRLSIDEIQEITQVEGRDYVDQALARGKGVILVSAHLGSVDVLGQLPMAYGIPLTVAVQHIQPERLFQYTLGLRKSHGMRMYPADGPLMELFRALKRGEMIGLPADRGIADSSREVQFFGSPARLPDGPVRVALRTGAALVPAFGLRLPDNSFLVQVEPTLELPHTGDIEADVAAGMEMLIAVMEWHISQHPEQWLVAAPVWPMD
jgi:lauroyl/myristoyl acyltransferase